MKVKTLLFILSIGMGVYCTACRPKSKKVAQEIKKASATSHQDSLLIGNWTISSMSDALCNVCPHIEFKRGGFAKIIRADNSFEYVQWHINDKQMMMMTLNSTFRDSTYQMFFEKDSAIIHLTLKNGTAEYGLSRW